MSRHSSLAAFASLFLLASATSPNNNRPECLRTRSQELASMASCGDEGSLNYCFTNLVSTDSATPMYQLTAELKSCFVSAGCTNAESQIEALWTLARCNEEPSELRRRRNGATLLMHEAAAMPEITMLAARQNENPTTTAPAFSNTEDCLVTNTVEITACPTQSTGGQAGKKLSCFPTLVPSPSCAPGKICQLDPQGALSCMDKQSKMPLEGIIIAIVFASFITISTISICFFCCRERRQQNRLIRAAEAAKIAQEAKTQAMIDAKKSASRSVSGNADRQPLMSQPVGGEDLPPLPQQYGGGYQQAPHGDYDNGHGQNPFTDAHPMR